MSTQEIPVYPPEFRPRLNDPVFVRRVAEKFIIVWEIIQHTQEHPKEVHIGPPGWMKQVLDEVLGPDEDEDEHEGVDPAQFQKWREMATQFAYFLADYAAQHGLHHVPLLRFAYDPHVGHADALRLVRDIVEHTKLHAVQVITPAAPPHHPQPTVRDWNGHDLLILSALANAGRSLPMADVQAHANRSKPVCSQSLKKLIDADLVKHIGKRGGYQITEAGRLELQKIPPQSIPHQ